MPAARATTDARPAAEIGWSNSGGESVEIYAAIGQFFSPRVHCGKIVRPGGPVLAVTLSTLLVAVSFQPLRRRIQDAVDRRFYRRRFDAHSAASAFSARLRAEIDLEALTHELLGVIDETLQPSHAAVWLRSRDHLSPR